MNRKDLSGIAIVVSMKLKNTVGKQITTSEDQKVIDWESKLIPRKIKKKKIHSLKNRNHIN